ncbi:unnamed protein product [Tilletia controversa]|nr:unnamed protein product [Tilletia controversa]CAD6964024.1 unnamed protein product [Tilletia controversa]
MEHVAIVGAGPVGSLAALALADRGCHVDLYERQPQPQPQPSSSSTSTTTRAGNTRSINLAISTRALTALSTLTPPPSLEDGEARTLADVVLSNGIPMRARMIHHMPSSSSSEAVSLDSQDYGIDPRHPRINVRWGCALRSLRFLDDDHEDGEGVELEFEHSTYKQGGGADAEITKETLKTTADMVIGCDGMHSVVRSCLNTYQPLDVEQTYIDSAYLELHIPAPASSEQGGGWPLSPHHLHIWPRNSFMLIALPNADRSFTCTLFAPYSLFGATPPAGTPIKEAAAEEEGLEGALSTPTRALALFKTHFPDALALLGEAHLSQAIEARSARPGRLGSVSLSNGVYHERKGGRAVLLGDAAHAMLPFYGQGLNCGLEDVRVLVQVLEAHSALPILCPSSGVSGKKEERVRRALEEYSKTRHPALCAILQLAQRNYEEMSHGVVSRTYLVRRWVDGVLMRFLAPRARPALSVAVLEKEEEKKGKGKSRQHTSILDFALSLLRSSSSSPLSTLLPSPPSPKITATAASERSLGAWKSLYSMVTFTNMPYDAVIRQARRQDRIVSAGAGALVFGIAGLGVGVGMRVWGAWR